MSITAAELICYGAASKPTDDVSTTGGAIDTAKRPVFTQFGSAAKLSLTSDGTDTRNVTIVGRLANSAIAQETIALTSAVEVLSSNTYERIQSVTLASGSGSRTVTLKQGSGGSTIATIPVNETGVYMMFQNSFSSGSSLVRYEKLFWYNSDGSLTLTSTTVTLSADPSGLMQIGLATSNGDSATIANRLAVPAGVSFVGVGTAQSIPSSGNLPSATGIGVWVSQTLGINAAAQKNNFTTQLQGQTT